MFLTEPALAQSCAGLPKVASGERISFMRNTATPMSRVRTNRREPGIGETCLVHKLDEASSGSVLRLRVAAAVEELLEVASQVRGPHAEHEADGVHEVRLPGPIGTDDRGELLERADLLMAAVGFEVLHLEAQEPTGGGWPSRHAAR